MDTYNKSKNIKDKSAQIQSKNKFDNIKSNYILKIIFNNLPKKNSLKIIKYNNNLKQRINININDYNEFSKLFSSIEIEIIPIKKSFGKFIHINIKEDEKHYHIYFDNNKEEIKRNHLEENEEVDKINVKIDYQIISFYRLFFKCECIKSIYFKTFFRINIYDMSDMFIGCSSLKKLNLSNLITYKVTDMSHMFDGCSSLEDLNLSNFITRNVINMSGMFARCSSLKELNLSNFKTSNVVDMCGMFSGCSSLKELNISNFNTRRVTDMEHMFSGCTSFQEINISNKFNILKMDDVDSMFSDCSDEFKNKIREKLKIN